MAYKSLQSGHKSGASWFVSMRYPGQQDTHCTSGVAGMRAGKKNSVALRTINLANGRDAAVPDSTGKLGALWLTADTIMALLKTPANCGYSNSLRKSGPSWQLATS